jgi:hypothetical protein
MYLIFNLNLYEDDNITSQVTARSRVTVTSMTSGSPDTYPTPDTPGDGKHHRQEMTKKAN